MTEVTTTSTGTTIRGTLRSVWGLYTLEFFASDSADPSGFGEGKFFLGSMDVSTDTTGVKDFTFSTTLPAGFPIVTATATNQSSMDTSEFSRAVHTNTVPTASNVSVQLPDDGEAVVTLRGSDPTETPAQDLVYTITALPTKGVLLKADGSTVTLGATFTGAPALKYQLRFLFGNATDSFQYTVTDNGYPAGSGTNPLTSAPATVTLQPPANSTGIARIGGTNGNDIISVSDPSGKLLVTVNGSGDLTGGGIALSAVTQVRAFGRAGADTLMNFTALPSFLSGGAGNDVLLGGKGNDSLDGGTGRDLLVGGAGDDFLFGGADSSSSLPGSGGDDILIGGRLSYFNAAAGQVDLVALDRIMAEWGSTADYLTRIAHLSGALGGGLNTAKTVTYLLNSSTIQDDAEFTTSSTVPTRGLDQLTGGTGLDWFLYGLGDKVEDKDPAETSQRI